MLSSEVEYHHSRTQADIRYPKYGHHLREIRMITIEETEIDLKLPSDNIGIVVMQPFINLSKTEPHRWVNGSKPRQIDRVLKTLQIAADADHNCDKTHFTVFPEYAIPGLEGVTKIEEVLNDGKWQQGTIILGGVEGLTKKEYSELCAGERTIVHPNNSAQRIRGDEWVNCAITWLKSSDSQKGPKITRWIQNKLCPSWPEENISNLSMFQGKCVYLFNSSLENGLAFRFMSMICFDWIGSIGTKKGISAILQMLNTQWNNNPDSKPIHLVFILQNNPKPNHASFLSNTYDYFHEGDYPFVNRDKCALLFANTAGAEVAGPCNSYGCTSIVFSSDMPYDTNSSPPSYAVHTSGLRNSTSLRTCKDALFRENGECAHSFRFQQPISVSQTPELNRRPLSLVSVHALDNELQDPRLPGEQVPAIVKWTNDRIDELPEFPSLDLHSQQTIVLDQIKSCGAERLTKMVMLGTEKMTGEDSKKVDWWTEKERTSLESISTSLTLISCLQPVTIKDAPAHAYIKDNNNKVIDIIVVFGGATHKENLEHALNLYPSRKERGYLIVSRDKRDTPLTDKEKKIYDLDPEIKRCGFHDLKNCLAGSTLAELQRIIKDYI